MEADSQIKILESQIRELYGRVVWTHKTQEKCADILWRQHTRIKFFQIALSALTTTGVFVTVFGENAIVGILSAILSTILFGLNAYTKDYDLGEISQKHSNAANDLWNIRESYLSLITDIRARNLPVDQIAEIRDRIQSGLYNTYKGEPRTISKAYELATKGLKANEELTFTKDELNLLLPERLRD